MELMKFTTTSLVLGSFPQTLLQLTTITTYVVQYRLITAATCYIGQKATYEAANL